MVDRDPSGCFKTQDKPTATVKKEGEHYYHLTMGERIMGGTNKAALEAYARKQGFVVRALDVEPDTDNVPCISCGRIDLPLHFNRRCAECGAG